MARHFLAGDLDGLLGTGIGVGFWVDVDAGRSVDVNCSSNFWK